MWKNISFKLLVLEVEVWVEIRKNNNWTVGQAYTKKCSFWLSFCSVFVVGCVKFILALEYVIWTNVGLVKGSVLWNNSFVVWQIFIIPSFIFSGAGLISWWEGLDCNSHSYSIEFLRRFAQDFARYFPGPSPFPGIFQN